MPVSLCGRTRPDARVFLYIRDGCKRILVLRVEHLESKLVRVNDDGKIVPRRVVERRHEQRALVVRTDAEHTRICVRYRLIERCPCHESAVENQVGLTQRYHTSLEVKDVPPVIWLDEHGLILMCEVQRSIGVRLHREVECRCTALDQRVEFGAIIGLVLLRDELATAEAELRVGGIAAWHEY